MHNKIFNLLVCLLFISAFCSADLHDYSGAVHIDGDSFLVVHDKKHPRDEGQPRAGILTFHADKAGAKYTAIDISWPKDEKPSSDLEACCRIPGTNQYLLAESGYYKGNYGRIFHVELDQSTAKASVKAVIRPFEAPEDGMTGKAKEIEGIACLQNTDGKLLVVLGQRGNQEKEAKLVWGYLDLTKKTFEKLGKAKLKDSLLEGYGRGCSDLHLVSLEKGWDVWSVATVDAGDNGPFRSVVYRAGTFSLNEGQLQFTLDVRRLWVLEGLKVEGLAGPAAISAVSKATVFTDDEFYGGVCRLLFAPTK